MDDEEAFELIDAHLDRQPLTDEQSDALTEWIQADPRRADEAFYRIFLHSYLRLRLQAGLPGGTLASRLEEAKAESSSPLDRPLLTKEAPRPARPSAFLPAFNRHFLLFAGVVALGLAGAGGWWLSRSQSTAMGSQLYAYEGFDYPATTFPRTEEQEFTWPTSGGLQGLNGGTGWSAPWEETNSKVAVIVDYEHIAMPWEPKDMRQFGPLGYTDALGNVLLSTGNQLRTATSPRSISSRHFEAHVFPEVMRSDDGIGRDGAVVWLSFLAQSSLSTADKNRYAYLLIGSKSTAGLRIGKLGAAPSGNWSAVALQNEAEVNLRTSSVPSGEMVFLVARVIFRPGPEDAAIWINPRLDQEPPLSEAAMRLQVPDFRFEGISIHANHSTDLDEIRFGSSYSAVAPIR